MHKPGTQCDPLAVALSDFVLFGKPVALYLLLMAILC